MTDTQYLNDNKRNRQRCEIWTRAMGYCRPVANFNKGKQSEFKERVYFTENIAMASIKQREKKVV